MVSGQTQDVTLLTPGATEAECSLDNGIRYNVRTGETVQIMRNESDIVVECYASGNRYRKMSIESDGNKWAVGNVATGIIPGITFDHFSKGLYEYPETITVDFIGVPTIGYELPDYHNKDLPNPYAQPIESYGPSTVKIPGDENRVKMPVKKKTRTSADPFASMAPASSGAGDGITPMPGAVSTQGGAGASPVLKGGTAEDLNRSMNPHVFRTN